MKIIFYIIISFYSLLIYAQSDTVKLLKEIPLPKLEVLIDSAMMISPLLDRIDVVKEIQERHIVSSKRDFLRGVALTSRYTYGNAGVLTTQESTTFQSFSTLNSSVTSQYLLGVNINMPIDFLVNRKNKIAIEQLRVDELDQQKEIAKLEIIQEITQYYYKVKLNYSLLKVQADKLQVDELNVLMTQKLFYKGESSVSELSRITEIYNKAQIDFEITKIEYQKTIFLLQKATGITLQ